VPAFSIGVKEASFNELRFARMVAVGEHGPPRRASVVNRRHDPRLLPAMMHHMDEPSDPFGVGTLPRRGCEAALGEGGAGGDGGDELFAGYDRFAASGSRTSTACSRAGSGAASSEADHAAVPGDRSVTRARRRRCAWLNEMSLVSRGERYAQSMSFLRFTPDQARRCSSRRGAARISDTDSLAKMLAILRRRQRRRPRRPYALHRPDDARSGSQC
jgi:asparagine synthase (glutamine-hydrolysing)